jgi:16S rRNA C967 or C1407 C5-methylase (RsmB/RsmF family)/NOL1/NOP2/fmu family ribosome biogenesis protein
MLDLPKEFVERMEAQLGGEAEAFFASLDTPSPTSIRLHHLKGKSSFAYEASVPWCSNGRYLSTRPAFHLDPHWHAGAYYVQEASSMVLDHVVKQLALDTQPRIWLDLCAAPGGKTGILASHLGPGDVLVANEVVGQRRSILRENLTRAGYLNTLITGENASSFQEPFADIILIDAPCAGEGMMRKEPEAIRQWTPALVNSCSHLQKEIVTNAARSLKENGYLIYSTCSYSMEENINNILYFIQEFQLHPVRVAFPEQWGVITIQEEGAIGYQLYPHKVKGEGLFMAVLKNTSPAETRYRKFKKPFNLFETPPEWLASHLAEPENMLVRKNNPQLQMITVQAETKANEVLMHLPRAEVLAEAGELKGKDFVPAHYMAMAGFQGARYEIIDLELSGALDYLERTVQSLPADRKPGWYLCRFEGTLLGWVKYTPQGWKNHYPMNWRLRDRKPK